MPAHPERERSFRGQAGFQAKQTAWTLAKRRRSCKHRTRSHLSPRRCRFGPDSCLPFCFFFLSMLEITDHSVLGHCSGGGKSSSSLCRCSSAPHAVPCMVFTGMDRNPQQNSLCLSSISPPLNPRGFLSTPSPKAQ